MRPRIFVSSVVNGFEAYREAARQGVAASGGEPVLANEDFPALAASSRNACLDGVDSCDIYIVIVGARGGWTTPSGKLVVEEEYEEARRRKLPILAFIQNVERDEDAQRFVERLSDYIDGVFRPTFTTPTELGHQVEAALTSIVGQSQRPKTEHVMIQRKIDNPHRFQNQASLRLVLAPERDEEVLDTVSLDSEDTLHSLLELGHDRHVKLFSFEHGKTTKVEVDSLVITQADSLRGRNNVEEVRLEVTTRGVITVDLNVTGRVRRGSLHDMMDGFVVAEEDVVSALRTSFAFADAFYNKVDAYKRHQRFLYNAVLSGLGYRKLVAAPRPQGAHTMSMREDRPVPAFDSPRLISRSDLDSPEEEIKAALTLFRRRLKD